MSVQSMAIAVLLVSFLVMILLRFPIAYAVALSSLLCLLSQGLPLTTICQQMVKGISSFSLMAVPFFITMGVLMGTGGISDKLIALADACVGWMTGGMAMVNIVASYFFGGISGSASADTASIGSIMIPMMVDQGYDDDFSTAVTITSSCEGLLVPPSHNMVIYAMSAGGVSVGSLFLAGYVPGALLAISLMIGSYIISKKRHYPKGDKFSVKRLLKQLGTSFWALAAVVIVVVGVVAGWFTATESAAIAVFYSLIVSVYIYKGLTWKGVWKSLEQCIDTLSIVLILISTSSIFGYCLTTLHVPDLAAKAIIGFSSNPIVIALLDEFNYARRAIAVRAMEYLLKPVEDQELVAVLEEAVRIAEEQETDREAGEKKSAEQISAERDCHEDTADTERSRIRLQAVAGNIQAFIEHNYMDDISLQTVAEAMNYSDAYFCKIFKQCFDKNFIVYLSEYRVARAKELLGDVLINVKDVSQKVGYRDSNYFAKVFKRIAGVTPTEYRMQVLKEAGER